MGVFYPEGMVVIKDLVHILLYRVYIYTDLENWYQFTLFLLALI